MTWRPGSSPRLPGCPGPGKWPGSHIHFRRFSDCTERLGLPGVRDRFGQWPRGEWSGCPGKLRPDDAAPCTVLSFWRDGFCRMEAASGVFRQRIRTRPSARPCRSLRRAAGIGPEVGTSVRPAASACGRCLRRGGAARTWSRPRAVAAGPASRWRRAGRGLPGARLPRVSVRGRGPRGPGGADAWFPRRPSVRRVAAGRGLRARPVRGRRASW